MYVWKKNRSKSVGSSILFTMDMISVTLSFYFTIAPEIFCVSVEGTTARICWKDNTNGSAVDHYQLQFAINGQNVTSHPVGIVGKRDEVCTQVRAGKLQAGNRLKFTIKVYNKTHWSPESVERFVNITKDGTSTSIHFKVICNISAIFILKLFFHLLSMKSACMISQ